MRHSEYVAWKKFTYFPKKMTSGKWVWWSEYYHVEDSTNNADPRHMILRTTLYTEQEWMMRKLAGDDVPARAPVKAYLKPGF
jgi:hypothetical protein